MPIRRALTSFILLAAVASTNARAAAELTINATGTPADFPLSANGKPATILIDPKDAEVVRTAAHLLTDDIDRVTGTKVPISNIPTTTTTLLAGTLGTPAIDAAIAKYKIDNTSIHGKWESYTITVLPPAQSNIQPTLLIIGSDPRGTAYGLLALSKAIGVSPWYWWSDVPVTQRDAIYLPAQTVTVGPPAIKYRGIFINDEDFSLTQWAKTTFEPEHSGIGSKTYDKLFELLLRLRGNLLWPAMHDVSKPFNSDPQNKLLADKYGIVMGASHCEPLLRDNVGEWNLKTDGPFNYQTNADRVLKYWAERLETNGKYENFYTVGMRGVHDGPIEAKGTTHEKVALIEKIITDQRTLFKKFVSPDVEKIPQLFLPYKEVLPLYQAGMKVPEDITLGWCDDNFGYIRQVSTPEEQKRPGGSGIYYHISYWGSPHDQLWLNSTSPALMKEELTKALDNGADKLWILNVGGLKPREIGVDYFFKLAENPHDEKLETPTTAMRAWAKETFGEEHADAIGDLLASYFQLNIARKPEHMGFNTGDKRAPVKPTDFSMVNYGDEAQKREDSWKSLQQQAQQLEQSLPEKDRDAFFELAGYSVQGAALMNQKWLEADRATFNAAQKLADAGQHAKAAINAYEEILALTTRFNTQVANGKWKNYISSKPRSMPVFDKPAIDITAADTATKFPTLADVKSRIALPPPADNATPNHFEEHDGVISISADHFTAASDTINGAKWKPFPGLGRVGNSAAISAEPTTVNSVTDISALPTKSPWIEFTFNATKGGAGTLQFRALPTHRLYAGREQRIAYSLDGATPILVAFQNEVATREWSTNVLRGYMETHAPTTIAPGKHTLRLYMVDPGILLQNIYIDLGGLKLSDLGPPETLAS